MKIWLITDTHFGHENIKKYCGRPDGFEDIILDNISKYCRTGDMLIHLGDTHMGAKGATYMESFAQVTSQIHTALVLGNHDKDSRTKYLRYFDSVFDSLSLNGVYLSHHGVKNLPSDFRHQVYGHHHNSKLPEEIADWSNAYRLSIEFENYKPVLLDTIVGRISKGLNGDSGEHADGPKKSK